MYLTSNIFKLLVFRNTGFEDRDSFHWVRCVLLIVFALNGELLRAVDARNLPEEQVGGELIMLGIML